MTREPSTGSVVLATSGPFDGQTLDAVIRTIALVPDDAALILDLHATGTRALHQRHLDELARALADRSGAVSFRNAGRSHGPLLRALPII